MKVLVITPQFPFPARSGFAMRVLQLLRQLAARHDVVLLSYARPEDRDGVEALRQDLPVRVVERSPTSERAKRVMQIRSIASWQPFASRAIYSAEMQLAINEMCRREQPDVIQLESSVLSAFALPRGPRVVLDEHNIESELLQRMGERERSHLRRAFNLWEYRRYRRFEQRCWQRVNGCLITSAREQPLVSAFAPAARTVVVPNGVDLDYFSPSGDPVVSHSAVFNGVLDYRPNLDAAYHLVEDVWPLVVQQCPGAQLTLVGRGYAEDVRRLSRPGIAVTGEVPDIRPYLKRAAVVTVPVRIGGGTRLKVVEGLAMAKAMVSTSLGCEGVAVRDRAHLLIGDGAPDFAGRILELFADPPQGVRLGQAGRRLIEAEYSWDSAGERMDAMYSSIALEGHAPGPLLGANR